MKKWLLLSVAVLCLFFACVYVLIPSTIEISDAVSARTTRDGTFRMLMSENEWAKWWGYALPERNDSEISREIFKYRDYKYNLIKPGFNSAVVSIQHDNNTINATITLLQLSIDSIVMLCQCSLDATANPFRKIGRYAAAVDLKKNMEAVLESLKAFVEKDDNIYGLHISEGHAQDTLLITTKRIFTREPGVSDVYAMIDDLRKYAAENKCRQTNPPMLNILHEGAKYRVMVAIPIDKEIATQGPISFVKMTNGNFMITQVQGGPGTVQNALQQMQLYFDDYDKTSMAITFQYLVTDRIKEPDTTKWVTKIFAPVM